MDYIENEELTMEQLLAEQERELDKIKVGNEVKASIKEIKDDYVLLNLETGFDAIIPYEELNMKKGALISEVFNVGDEIEATIAKVSQKDGLIKLSKTQSDKKNDYKEIKNAFEEHKIITVSVEKCINNGVFARYGAYSLFIPISQLDTKFVTETNAYANQNLEVYVKEINTKRNRLVASHRDVLQERLDVQRAEKRARIKAEREAEKARKKQEKEDLFNSLQVGQKIEGKVTNIMSYGAFIDIGGIEGLAHIKNLSWNRVNKVEDVLSEGQEVSVYVLDINPENKRIALALKDINNDPWELISKEIKVGDVIEGTVVRVIERAAFVQIREGVDAYLPISELANERVAKVTNVVNVGDVIKAKVLEFKPKNERLLISIKEANREPEEDISEYMEVEDSLGSIGELFGDKFKELEE
ncbi:MAG: S1 RNA-binding domain-containing protein [Clostridioides sp.]|jgi:small subunit ribosomal protein S1|nr:S1 RNA-binding domain-containing protein [Clostridioides sp.]